MTPEELDAAILAMDEERCVALIEAATEEQRRACAPVAKDWWAALTEFQEGKTSARGKTLPWGAAVQDLTPAINIAYLGTVTLGELKKDRWSWRAHPQAPRVLRARRPPWLSEWAAWICDEVPQMWPAVRAFIRDGMCEKPSGDGYILGLVHRGYSLRWTHVPNPRTYTSLREMLLDDPELLEDEVWRLFEVEGNQETSLTGVDKYSKAGWSAALADLARDGYLSRERLLDASLDALQRDFPQFRAGWYSRFHEELQPTPEERAARQERYLALLASPIPPTVSFALKALTELEKAGKLDGGAFAEAAAPALYSRQKATVTGALKLLDRIARTGPELRPVVARAALEALAHESPEVQGAAFALVERHGDPADAELTDLVRSRLEDTAPSVRPRLEAWLPASGAPPPAPSDETDEAEDLRRRAAALPEPLRTLTGIPRAEAALGEGTGLPSALEWDFFAVPRLRPENALSPIEDLDELIAVCASVLENSGPPDDAERALDGISRLCGERPSDFDRRVGPLRKRAADVLKRSSTPFRGFLLRSDFCALVVAWTSGTVVEPEELDTSLGCFLSARALEVTRRAARGEARPLLAAPTHAGGWIDPAVLVGRMQARQGAASPTYAPQKVGKTKRTKVELSALDLIQALLRLSPDGRAGALATAGGLQGEEGDAVRYALGADGIEIGPSAALWVAAARARRPHEDDPAVEARHPALGPDCGMAARPELWMQTTRWESPYEKGKVYTFHTVKSRVQPPPREDLPLHLPTALHHGDSLPFDLETRRWCASVWPQRREAWYALGLLPLANNVDWVEAEWPNRTVLETLLEPDDSFGPVARLTLGVGLGAKEPGESSLALDALIASVDDGRLAGSELAELLSRLVELGMGRAARWAKTLAEAARVSALHGEVVRVGLEGMLVRAAEIRPAELGALLEVLYEISVGTAAAVTNAETRKALEGVKGGKGGKLAKALLTLTEGDRTAHLRAAAARALEGRIARAERWA